MNDVMLDGAQAIVKQLINVRIVQLISIVRIVVVYILLLDL